MAGARLDVRQRLLRDRPGLLIVDDTYNAAPLSVAAALELFSHAPGSKVAVLGDMLELGPDEHHLHLQIGAAAAGVVDWLITVGPRGAWIADGAEAASMAASRILRTGNNQEAVAAIERIIAAVPATSSTGPELRMRAASRWDASGGRSEAGRHGPSGDEIGWSVLIKGSRGMAMEEIVEEIRGQA